MHDTCFKANLILSVFHGFACTCLLILTAVQSLTFSIFSFLFLPYLQIFPGTPCRPRCQIKVGGILVLVCKYVQYVRLCVSLEVHLLYKDCKQLHSLLQQCYVGHCALSEAYLIRHLGIGCPLSSGKSNETLHKPIGCK